MADSLPLIQTIRQGMDVVTHRAFHAQGRFVKGSGLSMAQFGILMQLHYQQHCGISDISSRMDITNAAASQLVDKLVQAGLLERSEDPNDRRAKQLKLTEKGRDLVETGMAERYVWVDTLVTRLEPAEIEKVAEVMSLLSRTLRQMREQEKSVTE
jgi:MarR family transcriptional regulator, organic hydroperoxide resistance regulator